MKTPGPLYIVAAGTLAAAAYVLWANQSAAVVYTGDTADGTDSGASDSGASFDFNDIGSSVSNIFTSVSSAVSNPNVQAFLALIRTGEGTTGPNGYRTLFGGGLFNDYSRHPNIAVTRGALTSTAAGAYQILYRTWVPTAAAYGLTDFSPASQDVAAVALIKGRGALADVIAGRFDTAIAKCNKEWASLPGSPYGQPTLTLDRAHAVLVMAGGNQTDGAYA
jgi:lysozyme